MAVVKDPKVTLDVEAFEFEPETRDTGMTMWNVVATAHGDDGKQYWINMTLSINKSEGTFTALPLGGEEVMGLCSIGISWETGKIVQSPTTVYKIAEFPDITAIGWYIAPASEFTIKRSEHEVAVDFGDYHILCKDDMTWHFNVEDKEKGIKAEFVHRAIGHPTWYGKPGEELQRPAPHINVGGYFWSGIIEGTLTIEGRKVAIKGKGTRERHWGVDECAAEEGAWMEWMWFHFDEMFGGVDELKFAKYKELSLYLVDEEQYFQEGVLNIEHHDWAYLRPLGAFIPSRHKVTIETEAGVLEFTASAVGCTLWGVTGEVPDAPIANLHWDKVEGTFTYKDGRKKTLTNGLGGALNRRWKPYPSIIIPELEEGSGLAHIHK